jgi:tetratricopeptide (TPR) repeat protein
MNRDSSMTRGLCLWACLLALAGGLAGTAGLTLHAHFGGILLTQGDNGVSRLFVGEAARMDNAGETDKALVLYEKAFRAGFSYPPDKSRALTLKGLLLWRQGRVRDAWETLSAAASGTAPNFGGAHALVEALLHLKRVDEAQSVIRRWREALGERGDPQARADMFYCAGRVAQERGDVKGAQAAYEDSAALVPGNPAEYRLGVLCADAGNAVEARTHLDRFLLGGASGGEAEKARELRRTIEAADGVPK